VETSLVSSERDSAWPCASSGFAHRTRLTSALARLPVTSARGSRSSRGYGSTYRRPLLNSSWRQIRQQNRLSYRRVKLAEKNLCGGSRLEDRFYFIAEIDRITGIALQQRLCSRRAHTSACRLESAAATLKAATESARKHMT